MAWLRGVRNSFGPLLLLCSLIPAHPTRAATSAYSRRWFTMDGGGVIVSSEATTGYRLGGTIGQPDASTLSAAGYRLRGGFWSGPNELGWVGVPTALPVVPGAFRVLSPSPNPSYGPATIAFELPAGREVVVRVCDIEGRLVRELDRSRRDAGAQRLVWDGRDNRGGQVPRGLYFVHIDAGRDHGVVKLVFLTARGAR